MSCKKENVALMEPQDRLKILSNCSTSIEVDPHIPPKRYYRSGVEMVRMANVYYEEGNLENAYVLYMKFMTLFIEKIRKHPDISQVDVTLKQTNQQKLREILPRAEKLKKELLDQYSKEYNIYQKIKEKEEEDARRQAKEAAEKELRELKPVPKIIPTDRLSSIYPPFVPPANIDNICYPDPFTSKHPSIRRRSVPKSPEPTTSSFVITQPDIDRSNKPSVPEASFEQAIGIRTVSIPASVMTKFLMLARHNTLSNVETCGILAGILNHNILIITHMIVPKQNGTSDSCTTMNEEEIFDHQDQLNLITIGWIHTHPTQTAFLSSVDLHTQCPYQLLMPEAIAIVCAPKYNETGIYVLTQSGLNFIANCRKTGFHPHPTDPPLFTIASHVKIDHNATLEILDLRTK